jgi:hypothetical protein
MRALLIRREFTYTCKAWSFLGLRFGPLVFFRVRIDYFKPHEYEVTVKEQSRPSKANPLKIFAKEIEKEKTNILKTIEIRSRVDGIKSKLAEKERLRAKLNRAEKQSFEEFRNRQETNRIMNPEEATPFFGASLRNMQEHITTRQIRNQKNSFEETTKKNIIPAFDDVPEAVDVEADYKEMFEHPKIQEAGYTTRKRRSVRCPIDDV